MHGRGALRVGLDRWAVSLLSQPSPFYGELVERVRILVLLVSCLNPRRSSKALIELSLVGVYLYS